MTGHRFIIHEDKSHDLSEVRRLSAYIMNRYLNDKLSISKLRKIGRIDFNWTHPKSGQKMPGTLSLDDVNSHILKQLSFDESALSLPQSMSPVLDSEIDVGLPQPLMSRDGKRETAKISLPLTLGDSFPVSPKLDREGFATSNLQALVTKNIVDLHETLVTKSDQAVSIRDEWFFHFRMLLNECVSTIDMQLHKLYLLAEYRAKDLGWEFNEDKLGLRSGQRIMDKFRWVGLITGDPLDNAVAEKNSFRILKDLRNHLTHFDPPCFCCTVEELCQWLNMVPDIGRLLWKIREKANAQLIKPIVELVMLPKVQFVPISRGIDRPISNEGVGYKTSNWPAADTIE